MLTTVLLVLALAASATFRGDARHTGVYDAPGVPVLHGVKWQYKTGGKVLSSPAVANGMAYVGSTDGTLYAVDAATGAEKWKHATRGRITSSPAVDGGVVFFTSYDSQVYALDAATGARKWTFKTKGERRFSAKGIHGIPPADEVMPDPFDFFLSSPVVVSGMVYVGSGDGGVYAIDAASGAARWSFQTGDVVHASPAVADGTVYVGSWDTYFYAIDAITGKEKWRFKTGEDPKIHNQIGIQSSAAVVNGLIYFGCRDSKLYALDAKTGAQVWAYDNKGSWVIGSPAVRDGRVYFATSDSALFHAVDARTGADVFSLTFKWPMFSSPAVAGNLLYIGSHEGKLTAIDLSKRDVAWVFQTDGHKEHGAALTAANGKANGAAVFASNFYDDIVAGVQRQQAIGSILSSPVVVDDLIYVGSADGNLYAVY